MSSWSLRWRILAEVLVLVVITTLAATWFDVPGAVVVGILAVVAGGIRARHLSSQFSRMTDSVLRTASIDRSYRIQPEGPAELARMARAVNRLADRLVAAMESTSEERARLTLILESMAEGVMLIDADGIVEFANPTAVRFMGPAVEYSAGDRLITLNNNFDLNELGTLSARTGNSASRQIHIRDSNKTVQAHVSPLDDRDGRRKTVLILTDMTAVRQAEVTRREFVSNASHELRTPIAAIRASAETLQRGAGDDPSARANFLDRILEDSERIERMVIEMLDLSRLESGQVPLDEKPVNVAQFLDDTRLRFVDLAAQSGVEVSVSTVDPDVWFRADAARIEQVFANLITNALKAMPGGGSVRLGANIESDRVSFTVRDNGPGIPSVHLPHLFERFYKVDASRSDEGTGLGLAIARHIVQLHGGQIRVESVVGAGTNFTVSMRRVDPPER